MTPDDKGYVLAQKWNTKTNNAMTTHKQIIVITNLAEFFGLIVSAGITNDCVAVYTPDEVPNFVTDKHVISNLTPGRALRGRTAASFTYIEIPDELTGLPTLDIVRLREEAALPVLMYGEPLVALTENDRSSHAYWVRRSLIHEYGESADSTVVKALQRAFRCRESMYEENRRNGMGNLTARLDALTCHTLVEEWERIMGGRY